MADSRRRPPARTTVECQPYYSSFRQSHSKWTDCPRAPCVRNSEWIVSSEAQSVAARADRVPSSILISFYITAESLGACPARIRAFATNCRPGSNGFQCSLTTVNPFPLRWIRSATGLCSNSTCGLSPACLLCSVCVYRPPNRCLCVRNRNSVGPLRASVTVTSANEWQFLSCPTHSCRSAECLSRPGPSDRSAPCRRWCIL